MVPKERRKVFPRVTVGERAVEECPEIVRMRILEFSRSREGVPCGLFFVEKAPNDMGLILLRIIFDARPANIVLERHPSSLRLFGLGALLRL